MEDAAAVRAEVRSYRAGIYALTLALALAGCASTASSEEASVAPSEQPAGFPTAAFADISDQPVSEEVAAEFQAILRDMARGGGMAATVMSPDGTWSGAAGTADGVRDVRVDDQFAVASITKSVIAAQVMQLVEAGELALDDPAADHVPADIEFDTNEATIRQLLSMRSGIPDYEDALWTATPDGYALTDKLSTDLQRRWTPAELLELVGTTRSPAGDAFDYSSTNYVLLGLIIEQVRGRALADVLRDGVLSGDGLERLVFQPDEAPTEPMAMPGGKSAASVEKGGGYLPSMAEASAGDAGSAMASDSASLARWWRAFCAGEIVSQASLAEMATFTDGYGLGLYDIADPYARAVGHTGEHVGYVAWAGCLPEDGSVVVVLSNRVVEDVGGMARPLVVAAISN